jgi:NAD(P)H-dependent FMN reductase
MKILAISGSIRKESSNSALLKAIHNLLPANIEWTNFKVNELPFFDPQIQFGFEVPLSVQTFRHLAHESDFIVISTPEYAHGIPGILKNALEWLVCEETIKKKVIIFVSSPSGGDHVKEYLLETLRTMDMLVAKETTFVVQSARKDVSTLGDISDLSLKTSIIEFLKSVRLIS